MEPHWQKCRLTFNDYGQRGRTQGRKLRYSWLRGVKGCFVFGQNHMENDKHPREEVRTAIKKLGDKYPSALLSLDDVSGIHELCEEGQMDDDDAEVQWAEEE